MNTDEAERIFTGVFLNLTAQWGEASEFRRIASIGEPKASAQLRSENLSFAKRILEAPELRMVSTDPEEMVRALGGLEGVQRMMTDRQVRSFRRSVDHAAVVFMHAALDAAVSDLCRVTSLVAPEDWRRYIENKKVTLAAIRDEGYDAVFGAKLSDALAALERESLLKRADRLFALCKPEESFAGVGGFTYDRTRLELLDEYRHAVVHRSSDPPEIGDVGVALSDLLNNGLHLFGMVNHRYGVKVNPLYVLDPAAQKVIREATTDSPSQADREA